PYPPPFRISASPAPHCKRLQKKRPLRTNDSEAASCLSGQPTGGERRSCYIARLLSKPWSTFSLTSTSTTRPSLTTTVSRPNPCIFKRARASSSSLASRLLTPGGKPVTEFGLSNSHPRCWDAISRESDSDREGRPRMRAFYLSRPFRPSP